MKEEHKNSSSEPENGVVFVSMYFLKYKKMVQEN